MISHWLNLQISYRIIFTLLPGGSGPPLGRHDDRSPRSSVDSRQTKRVTPVELGSQETRELELSQRRMRSPWRVPRRSAGRRARPEWPLPRRSIANGDVCWCCAAHGWHAPFGASPPSFLRMILSENRTPLFGIMRGPGANLSVRGGQAKLGRIGAARTVPLARHCERQRSNPDGLRENLDCFVAIAPRNDEVRRPGMDILTSSLADLIRQSMRTDRKLHRRLCFAARQHGPPGQAQW